MMMNMVDCNTYVCKEVVLMGFTNSEYSEELLHKSHSLGIKDELWETVSQIRKDDPFLTIHEAIEKAYYTLTN
jgi:hypothetical protein